MAYLTRTFPIRQIASAQAAIETAKATRRDGVLPSRAALFAAPLTDDVTLGSEPIPAEDMAPTLAARRQGEDLRPLEFAAEEVSEIARVIETSGSSVDLDPVPEKRATRQGVISSAGEARAITHFSCHGLLDNEHPELSGLVLEPEPGELSSTFTASEILLAKIRSELTVLSACDTGHGKLVEGEGAIALTRSFLASGSRSVVASLWKVPDLA
ncbi:MAG: CHAT domain-containing protein, partial [Solirubrobacterales bacterium]|nr:CHAT domain-containing protein [Solirubrobacterales bacterium]